MTGSLPSGWTRRAVASVLAFVLVAVLLPLAPVVGVAQEPVAQADATLRFVQASPGAPNVDVLVDGLPILEGLPFGTVTEYATVTPGEHRLQVVPEGQPPEAALIDEVVDAAPGAAYILALYGRLNEVAGAVYTVDLSEIEPGNARVRLINLSTDADDIDLLETGGEEWFGGVGIGDAADYTTLPAGTYSADVRGTDDRVLATLGGLEFVDTRVYDVIALGQVVDGSLSLAALETLVTPPCVRVLGIEADASDACLRVVHAAPDAPPVDIYLNDALLGGNLDFGTATEYGAIPSGEGAALRIVPTGSPVEEAAIDAGLDFEPGQAYVIVVRNEEAGGLFGGDGAGEALGFTITGTDLRPVPEGQARLRVIHASPDAGAVDVRVAGSEPLFEGVDFGAATEYAVIDAGNYAIEVYPSGDDLAVSLRSEATIDEATSYDLVALGRPSDRSLRLLALQAPLDVRRGEAATPQAIDGDEALTETVVPEVIDAEATATP